MDIGGDSGWYSSIALDSSDNPHISYFDENNWILKYAYCDGSWHIESVDTAGYVGMFTSIALDSAGNPHISYYDWLNQDLKYAYYDGSWHIETVDTEGDVGYETSIALDSSDNPHISYWNITNQDLKYAYYDGSWHTESIDTASWYTSIAIDSADNPHISYTTDFALKYAYYDGSSWHIESVDDGYLQDISITLDSSDNPHISYFDSNNLDLKYAWYGSVGIESPVAELDMIQNAPNPFNALTNINFALAQSSPVTISIYNVVGQLVSTLAYNQIFEGGSHSVQWNGQSFPPGIYFCRLCADGISQTHRMLIVR